jgi:predicted AAA+ superfamily ATPase
LLAPSCCDRRSRPSSPLPANQEIAAVEPSPRQQIVIDEIQKIPALLDEVHWLIENRGLHFALCGSSARKVRRGAANLLGGRATRYELHGMSASELGREFDLNRMLNHGYLPRIYEASRPRRLLDAYVADYLKDEIAAEGLVRNLPTFSDFLDVAALSDGEIVNFSNIARECGVSSHTTKRHPARALAPCVPKATQAPGDPCTQVLLRGRRRREPAGASRRSRAGIRALREGLRELGLP